MDSPLSEIVYEDGSEIFIKSVRVKDVGCIQDVKLNLTPLHAFIGPNDSGKLTLMSALISRFDRDDDDSGIVVAELSQRAEIAKQLITLYRTDEEAYFSLRESVKRFFPYVYDLCIYPTLDGSFQVEVMVKDDQRVDRISNGLLNYLSFSLLPYRSYPYYCVVSPEVGMHPTMIKENMKILRELSKKAQVFIITYNPFVLNEMHGNEVTVVTRDVVTGTQATRLCDTPCFAERSKVYALGELWVAYSNGMDEKPLFTGSKHD